jgi:hypothetical protein
MEHMDNFEEKYQELYKKFNFRLDMCSKEINGLILISIDEIIKSIKLVDPNNDSGLIGFWNNLKLYIEKNDTERKSRRFIS